MSQKCKEEESSDKENVAIDVAIGANVVKSAQISSDEYDFAENIRMRASKKLKKHRKAFKIEDSDAEEEDEDCGIDSFYNTQISFDSYESPNETSRNLEAIDDVEPLVLDTDNKNNEQIVVHPKIASQLKPHQVDGLRFLFKSCYNDLNVSKLYREMDHGCILAHCMGLGKTLQLIALLHTVIRYPQLKTQKILVICPKSTVLNWQAEIDKWLGPIELGRKLKVFTFPESSSIEKKIELLKKWFETDADIDDHAGCLLLGYEAFMKIVSYSAWRDAKRSPAEAQWIEKHVEKYLLKPGADLVILDEGHRIKNLKTATSKAVNRIKTKRRIILTGTPMQNHLQEYYSMINFIKPDFLGSKADFAEDYANPIKKGQHKDSSPWEVREMVEKSFILHRTMSNYVQRRDVSVLKEFLPKKYEYDIFIPMTEIQNHLYRHYLNENPLEDGKSLLPDYHTFRKIWTHPKVMQIAYEAAWQEFRNKIKAQEVDSDCEMSSDDEKADFRLGLNGELIIAKNGAEKEIKMFSPLHEWWKQQVDQNQLDSILSSNKFKILFDILKNCEQQNEKCLIFSEYTKVLDAVEFVMKQITKQVETDERFEGLEEYVSEESVWNRAWDYYRMDGSTSQSDRHDMINRFNNPNEKRLRAFLISSKAGGQGINLTGASRVILLDTSWNPSNDQQSIFRVFRLGQDKVCYIYRLLAMGTMEEKVYSRSVTKQATSCRVVDKQQIERHYNMAELEELYTLTIPNMSERPVPNMPDDKLLAYLLDKYQDIIYKYQEHESLLEEVEETVLTEEQKEDLWIQYKVQQLERGKSRTRDTTRSSLTRRSTRRRRTRSFLSDSWDASDASDELDESDEFDESSESGSTHTLDDSNEFGDGKWKVEKSKSPDSATEKRQLQNQLRNMIKSNDGDDANKPSEVDDKKALLLPKPSMNPFQPLSDISSRLPSPGGQHTLANDSSLLPPQLKAEPSRSSYKPTTGKSQLHGETQMRKMMQRDIGDSLHVTPVTPPAKRLKAMQSTLNANQSATQADGNGAKSSRPATPNQKFSDDAIVILDD